MSARVDATRIRELNDTFRRSFCGGRVVMTSGVSTMPEPARLVLLEQVRAFSAFGPDNDPYGEHDFGTVEQDSGRYFWKIDYYDRAGEFGSENPADPGSTLRVLTVMRADEY